MYMVDGSLIDKKCSFLFINYPNESQVPEHKRYGSVDGTKLFNE